MTTEKYDKAFDNFVRRESLKKIRKEIGRLDINTLDDANVESNLHLIKRNMQSIINQLRFSAGVNNPNKVPYIHFDFIDSLSFNALAGVDEEGNEFIGINYGSILIIQDIFNRILARRDTLTQIGSPELEENPDLLPNLTISYTKIMEVCQASELSSVVPKDPVRLSHANMLTDLAVMFLMLHELGHLRHGHVLYKATTTGNFSILEFASNGDQDNEELTKHVLELDADSFAATSGFGFWRELLINNPTAFTEIHNKYTSPETGMCVTWGISVWILFRLMDSVRKEFDPLLPTSHPDPIYRSLNAFGTVHTFLENPANKCGLEKLSDHISTIFKVADEAIFSITSQEPNNTRASEVYANFMAGSNNMQLYKDHWTTVVRSGLLPFTRTDLAD